MRSPFQMVRDWTQVKKMKEGLLEALRMTPAGACISVNNPADPVMARALIEILRENPNSIEMMDYGFSVTIMRKVNMVQSMTGESYRAMRANHQILSADSVVEFGLKNKDQLPLRKFRDGVPDNVNDEGAHTGDVKLILP